ncbi:MAG: D-cysteine desulfhydrase, partial [Sandarakinorhabdus sp.]|nr:D-cysteine desulfhydrase [Sandarakinorhabdus sp.]
MAKGADTLITVGAPQSNHCRLTLAAAAREGLDCRLVIEERVPGSYDPDALGNNLLFDLMGAASVRMVKAGSDLMAAMEEEAAAVKAA